MFSTGPIDAVFSLFEVHTCPLVALRLYLHSLESGSRFKPCRVRRGRRSCERVRRADPKLTLTGFVHTYPRPFVTSSRTCFVGSPYSSRRSAPVLGGHFPALIIHSSPRCALRLFLPSSYLICPFLTFVICCPPFCSRNSPLSPPAASLPLSPCHAVYAHHPASIIFSL